MSIASIQQGRNQLGVFRSPVKALSKVQQKMSQEVVFEFLKDVNLTPSNDLDSISSAIEFNQIRLGRAQENSLIYKRLNQRVIDLDNIKKAFETSSDNAFIGLVGWGDGCIQSGIKSRQNISSVDGFLYKDKNGHIHYQRLGSCLEYFLNTVSKPNRRSSQSSQSEVTEIYTENGKDINFNDETVYDGQIKTALNHSFSISYETIAVVCKNINQKKGINPEGKDARNVSAHNQIDYDSDDEGLLHLSGTKKVNRDFDYLEVDQFTGESKLHKLKRERRERRSSHLRNVISPLDSMSICHEIDPVTEVPITHSHPIDMTQPGAFAFKKCKDPQSNTDHSRPRVVDTRVVSNQWHPKQLDRESVSYEIHEHAGCGCCAKNTVRNGHAISSSAGLDVIDGDFTLKLVSHGSHSHLRLESVAKREKYSAQTDNGNIKGVVDEFKKLPLIGQSDEGCPCCTAGLDFDEFAAAIKLMISEASGASELHHLAHFDDGGHWGIFLGVALPFSVIGLTAAQRNMVGAKQNMRNLERLLNKIPDIIKQAQSNMDSEDCQPIDVPKYELLIDNLKVFERTLAYSMCDSMFNYAVPGAVNGVASSFVLLTGIWHQPFALPFITLYSLAQSLRNGMDFMRVYNHNVNIDAVDYEDKISQNPMIQDASECIPFIPSSSNASKIAGQKKVSQIAQSKRRFFSSNAFNFTVFTAGAVVTFISIPALAVGVGTATLPIGLGMLGYGAASTGIANNIWPNKFKPRNGDCGVDRLSLTSDSCLEKIGNRRELKKILKDNLSHQLKTRPVQSRLKRSLRYFYAKCITALPDLPNRMKPYFKWYPFGQQKGQAALHRLNQHYFEKVQTKLADSRTNLLNELLVANGCSNQLDNDSDFKDQWDTVKELGIADDVLNRFIQEELLTESSDCDCCSEDQLNSETLKKSDLFLEEGERLKLSLKDNLPDEKKDKLLLTLDEYLHFDFIEKLRYEQYALNDFFWELTNPTSERMTKIAKAYKPLKSSLKRMKGMVLTPYNAVKRS